MKLSRRFYNFNKEILIGEIGSIIGAQSLSNISSIAFRSFNDTSISAVIGAMIGSSLWLLIRAYDLKKHHKSSAKDLVQDIAYFTPAAFLLSCLIYYPLLFFASKSLLAQKLTVSLSIFISQFAAFVILLLALNIYRIILTRKFKKRL